MSINQCRQILAMTNSNGRSGGYWLNLSRSYPEGRMRWMGTYPGFSPWDFMKPNESMSKRKKKDACVSPPNLFADLKTWGLHLICERMREPLTFCTLWSPLEGDWRMILNLFPIPVFPHPSRGWKYQKKIREIRERKGAEGGLVVLQCILGNGPPNKIFQRYKQAEI